MKRRLPFSSSPPVNETTQTYSFTRRAMVLGGAQIGVAALLGGRMAWLSIKENEHYQLLSESNRVQMQLIPPRRGWIVDRAGQPVAINRSDFRVDLIPDQLKDPERILAELTRLLALAPDDVERIREELGRAAGYQPVAGRREPVVRQICGGDGAATGAAGRVAAARLLPLLSRCRRGRPTSSATSARRTRRNMTPNSRARC